MSFCSTLHLQPSHSSKTRPKSLDGLENVDPLAGQKADLCIGMESKELWHLWWEPFLNEPGHKMAQTPPTTNMQTFFRETPKAFGDSENMRKGSMSAQNIKFWCIQKVAPENDHVSPFRSWAKQLLCKSESVSNQAASGMSCTPFWMHLVT